MIKIVETEFCLLLPDHTLLLLPDIHRVTPAAHGFAVVAVAFLPEKPEAVLFIEMPVILGVGEQHQALSAPGPDAGHQAFPQHPGADPLPFLIRIHGKGAQVPGILLRVAGFHGRGIHIVPVGNPADSAGQEHLSVARPHILPGRRFYPLRRAKQRHGAQGIPVPGAPDVRLTEAQAELNLQHLFQEPLPAVCIRKIVGKVFIIHEAAGRQRGTGRNVLPADLLIAYHAVLPPFPQCACIFSQNMLQP